MLHQYCLHKSFNTMCVQILDTKSGTNQTNYRKVAFNANHKPRLAVTCSQCVHIGIRFAITHCYTFVSTYCTITQFSKKLRLTPRQKMLSKYAFDIVKSALCLKKHYSKNGI